MKVKSTPEGVWSEYEKGKNYNRGLELYSNIEKCENFYLGKQWEGLKAPDLPKPVFNVIKRVVSYFVSMIVSDDVAISLSPFTKTVAEIIDSEGNPKSIVKEELDAAVIEREVEATIERANVKTKTRDVIRDAAVIGDAYLYFYYDADKQTSFGEKGEIACETLDAGEVIFGNPYTQEIQKQPYIIIATPMIASDVRDMARKRGMSEDDIDKIHSDNAAEFYSAAGGASDLVTVLTKMWRSEDGTVHAVQTTKDIIIREEWSTQYTLYPISNMVWEKVKNSYHGEGAVRAVIPNQICINQLFAMMIHWAKSSAFPKIVYDMTKISNWTNKVGQSIGVMGNPREAVADSFRSADMSAHLPNLVSSLITMTTEYMGANDAALGNIKPDNTSAIIATQKASAMPLELQRFEFYRFTEEYVRIIIDMMRADYGKRRTSVTVDGMLFDVDFDYSTLDGANYNTKVEVGQASYWSELTQIQTMDNLFAKGIIADAADYLDGIPSKYVRNKEKLVKELRKKAKAAAANQNAAQMQQML